MSDFVFVGGGVTAPAGFRASGVSAGIKKSKKDLALLVSDVPAGVAGVFTTNQVKAAPLLVTMPRVASGKAQAIIINSGNANACNGREGLDDARVMGSLCARALGLPEEMVLVSSTGVIGQRLPMDRIASGIPLAVAELRTTGGTAAAEAIMTTDTVPKQAAVSFTLGGARVTLGGMAKGSGMIHPNMATMLAFVTTDAAVAPGALQRAVRNAVEVSFNMISVDGDTSTNDMLVVMANGLAGNEPLEPGSAGYAVFQRALDEVCIRLAKAIARDGEGATTLLEVRVVGAPTARDARLAARAICSSNLVKAAVFGRDANWGRIVCAAGYSGARFDPDDFDVYLGDLPVAVGGRALVFDEARASAILAGDPVVVTVDFKQGDGSAVAWGCDLSYDYVKINASYRT
ncbi:bifunctional glutamate N-acetyltransferase/amino-acid acetyltransferase ArgJ [Desulforudis sp. DRI-14]|uniref:bifunctional glutamate N-acetyltransferase/amino-acid acetyltransferase ArgJ n=1 Tax=Desulforudis sp. DRI-14 TaxID=3459793 RepID=UPI004042B941